MSDITLRGRLVDADSGALLPGLRVEAWNLDTPTKDRQYLGGDVSDAAGAFTVAFSDDAPDVVVEVYDGQALVASTEDAPLDDLADGIHDLAIAVSLPEGSPTLGKTAPPPQTLYRVTGTVHTSNDKGAPVSPTGLRLRATDAGSGRTLADVAIGTDGAVAFDVARPTDALAADDPVAVVHLDVVRPGETPTRVASDLGLDPDTPFDVYY